MWLFRHIMGITLIRMDLLCGFVYWWFACKTVSPDELENASLWRIRPRQHMFKHRDCNAVPAKQVAHWTATVSDNLRNSRVSFHNISKCSRGSQFPRFSRWALLWCR